METQNIRIRLKAFDQSMRDLYDSQWQHVQLDGLPNDTIVDGTAARPDQP